MSEWDLILLLATLPLVTMTMWASTECEQWQPATRYAWAWPSSPILPLPNGQVVRTTFSRAAAAASQQLCSVAVVMSTAMSAHQHLHCSPRFLFLSLSLQFCRCRPCYTVSFAKSSKKSMHMPHELEKVAVAMAAVAEVQDKVLSVPGFYSPSIHCSIAAAILYWRPASEWEAKVVLSRVIAVHC